MARLTVMTWNLHSGADWRWRKRLREVARTIADVGPDVVAFQEADQYWGPRSDWADQPGWLAEELGMELLFAPHQKHLPRGGRPEERRFGLGLLTRLPVVETHVHHLTTVSSRHVWPVQHPMLPEFVLDVAGTPVSAFSLHLDVFSAGQRVREARELVSVLAEHRRPVVLMGDLNADMLSRPLAVLRGEGGFIDVGHTVGPGVRTFPAGFPFRRLDHVLVRGMAPLRIGAGTSRASDHLPVVAELEVPDAER